MVLDLIAAVLAAVAVLRVWFRSSLTAGWRAYCEVRTERSILCRLLVCPFCLSHHVAFATVAGTVAAGQWWPAVADGCRPVMYALAAAPVVYWTFTLADKVDPYE